MSLAFSFSFSTWGSRCPRLHHVVVVVVLKCDVASAQIGAPFKDVERRVVMGGGVRNQTCVNDERTTEAVHVPLEPLRTSCVIPVWYFFFVSQQLNM